MQNKSIPFVLLFLSIILFLSACSPAWSRTIPQGQIVYKSKRMDPFQLTFLDMETGMTQDVAVSNYFNNPSWSFDGDYLFGLTKYPKIQVDGYPAYWDLTNGKFAQCKTVLAPAEQIQDAGNPDNPLEIVFSNGLNIFLFDLSSCEIIRTLFDFENLPNLSNNLLVAGFSYTRSEGTLLVGLADHIYGREHTIIIYDIDEYEELVLAAGINPSLSPDGKYIAFLGVDGALYLMKPDGSEQEILVDQPFWDPNYSFYQVVPSWSPDSKWLVYHRCEGEHPSISDCTIYKVNIETGIEVKLAEGGVFPSWGNR